MKIFDCTIFLDENMMFEVRLNTLDKYVDYFVIVESSFTHRGDKRNLKFNHKKFEKFKDKIIYLTFDKEPEGIEVVYDSDDEEKKSGKYILNAAKRENGQRNYIINGLQKANPEDLIMISDVDEIPNLEEIKLENLKEKILMFQQDMFYYKFDLKLPGMVWSGTKGCKKKDLLSPQWLRNIKDKKYPLFRLDIIFSKKKYSSIKFIDDGGWHFSNIKSAEEIEHKLRSYLHHREFDVQPLTIQKIDDIIKNKQAIYDLSVDKRVNKVGSGNQLVKYDFEKLPIYLKQNKKNYELWLD